MINARTIALALATGTSLAIAAPAAAQEVEFKPIEAKNIASGKYKIDPAKGYVLITSAARSQGAFIKRPDASEIAEYEAEWEKQFVKAQKRHVGALANWHKLREARVEAGDKPVEPTRETFSIGGIDRRMVASFGPMSVFEKDTEGDSKTFTYLTELEPGTYAYYGPVYVVPGAQSFGSCYCMGTVKFEVKAGEITNLGDFLSQKWASDADMRATAAIPLGEPGRVPQPASYPVPTSLTSYKVVQADWRAHGKLNNFFGLTVSRHPTVPGVLAYERDKVIDLRASAEEEAALASAKAAVDQAAVTAPAAVPAASEGTE